MLKNAAADYSKIPSQQTADLLRTLGGLKMVLNSQTLPQDQVDSIHRELQRIGADFMPKEPPSASAISAAQLITLLGAPIATPPVVSTPPVAARPLAAIPSPAATIPAPQSFAPARAPIVPIANPVSSAPQATTSIFDQLLAAGLVAPTPAPAMFVKASGVSLLDPASLKERRPHLVVQLYGAKPDQCRQCGRRFAATPEGKKYKAKHLDWHFQVNSRVADASNSVVHRSWYLDEREWIDYREDQDGLPVEANLAKPGRDSKRDPKSRWVPAPADDSGANDHCPICTEAFEKAWDKEADRPVWTDCVKVGNRYFHASCYEDFSKASALARTGSASGRNTPEPLLGKRKAAAVGGEMGGRTKSPRI